MTTTIAGRDVPIEPGPRTIIRFSGGRGANEEGDWEFWTAVGPIEAMKDGTPARKKTAARCRPGADPGERFLRMEGAPGYERGWAIARVAEFLRPATIGELERWLDEHPDDARYAEAGEVGGDKVRVVNEGGRYRVILGVS